MLAAIHDARDAAAGHEAVLVCHQLPIWTVRRFVERTHSRAPPRPPPVRARQPDVPGVRGGPARVGSYTEPAGEASRVKAVPGA